MSRRTTVTITIALGLTLLGGPAAALAAGEPTSTEAISTVREVDPERHLLVLSSGLNLVATDPAVLEALHAGDIVRVVFTDEGGRLFIDSIEALDREPSPYDQMHVGEGESTGAHSPIGHRTPGEGFSASPSPGPDHDELYGDGRGAEAP